MAILYKRFVIARTVFYTALACFFMGFTPVYAQTDLFTVENITVDVTAANALAARDQAFAAAQVQAFGALASRMLPETQIATFKAPDANTISPMIQDYEVTKEKLSTTRYVGTYTFRFKESAVSRYFGASNIPVANVSSKPVLVLPFYQIEGRPQIWSPYNAWMQAWNRSAISTGLVPVVVPIGELQDVRDIGEGAAFNYSPAGLHTMLSRYEAGDAIVTLAIPDTHLSLVDKDTDPATGILALEIYCTDRGASPQLVEKIMLPAQQGQTRGALFDEGVKKVYAFLQSDWKTKIAAVPAVQKNVLKVRVTFNNLQEWSETQRNLRRVPGVSNIAIKSLSPRSAFVDLLFDGTEERLRLALQQADMILSAPDIQPSVASYGYDQKPVYTLQRVRRQMAPTMPPRGIAPSQAAPPSRPSYSGQF
jgi:hypothetical protein